MLPFAAASKVGQRLRSAKQALKFTPGAARDFSAARLRFQPGKAIG
jgi:hypothetical protein